MRVIINVIVFIVSCTLIVLGVHAGCEAVKQSLREYIALSSDARERRQPPAAPIEPGQVWEQRFNVTPWGADVRLWTVLAVSNGWVRFESETGYIGALRDEAFRYGAERVR